MGSMTLAAVLVLLAWPTRWRWPVVAAMAVFVPMVGLSRVYLGVHFPSDILAGWAAALVWTTGAYLLLFRWKGRPWAAGRSEEHTSELQSLMRISYAVFCLKKKKQNCTKDKTG